MDIAKIQKIILELGYDPKNLSTEQLNIVINIYLQTR